MKPLRIAFVRPRLGIGGSERLVVDAARELTSRGHVVRVFAPGASSGPEFADVVERRVDVDGSGGVWPSDVGGRLRLPCALLRTMVAVRRVRATFPCDLVFLDVVAHLVPYAQRLIQRPVLFYCHFPDLHLTREGARRAWTYSAYRRYFDRAELSGLRRANLLAANSAFTAQSIQHATGPIGQPVVIHPGVHVPPTVLPIPEGGIHFVSIARFDPRKNLEIAIDALGMAHRQQPAAAMTLTLAGRRDTALPEVRKLMQHLKERAVVAGIQDRIHFDLDPSDAALDALIARSRAVIYTPSNEHFGYVPVEAMARGRPVVAVRSGGPMETIEDGRMGFLVPPTAEAFAQKLLLYATNPEIASTHGAAGRDRVIKLFSMARFADDIERACVQTATMAIN